MSSSSWHKEEGTTIRAFDLDTEEEEEENNGGDEIDGSIGPSAATARPIKEPSLLSKTQNHKDTRNTPHAIRRVCRFCFLEKELAEDAVVVPLLLILGFSLQS